MSSLDFEMSDSDIPELRLATETGECSNLVHLGGDLQGLPLKQLLNLAGHLRRILHFLPPGAVGDHHHQLADQVALVDLAQFPDDEVVSQFNVGETKEYGGRDGCGAPRLRSSNNRAIVESGGRPPPLSVARSVWAPHLHFIVLRRSRSRGDREFYGLATTCVLSEICLPFCLVDRNETDMNMARNSHHRRK